MDSLSSQQRKAICFGLVGLILILGGVKFALQASFPAQQSLELNQQPAILFVNVNQGCECMLELAHSADTQINEWTTTQSASLPVYRIDFDTQKKLLEKYRVFRAPCLILVDGSGNILWRQDYPLAEGGPFDLAQLEIEIQKNIQ